MNFCFLILNCIFPTYNITAKLITEIMEIIKDQERNSVLINKNVPLPEKDFKRKLEDNRATEPLINFIENDKIYIVRCPLCRLENYSMAVSHGVCAWCGVKFELEA